MYHLFGKIYVETEFRGSLETDQINIGMNSGFQHVDHVSAKFRGRQFGYGTSLDAVEDLQGVLTKAANHGGKVFIYADSVTYTRLYAAMIKALFPSISYDVFKMFFICAKATYDTSTVNLHDTVMDHRASVNIDRKVVDSLYARKDEVVIAALRNLFMTDIDQISLEWQIVRLKAFGQVGNIPETVENLQRRTALNNSHDAMDDWGRIIMDPLRWNVSGVTPDTLLDAPSTFEACKNFTALLDPMLRHPNVLSYMMPDDWLVELLDDIIQVMDSCGDFPCAQRNRNLRECLLSTDDLWQPELCLKRVNTIFDNGVAGFRLGHLDSVKYDENLIRYVLRQDEAFLQSLMEDSPW